jgi:hypothetical protein
LPSSDIAAGTRIERVMVASIQERDRTRESPRRRRVQAEEDGDDRAAPVMRDERPDASSLSPLCRWASRMRVSRKTW